MGTSFVSSVGDACATGNEGSPKATGTGTVGEIGGNIVGADGVVGMLGD